MVDRPRRPLSSHVSVLHRPYLHTVDPEPRQPYPVLPLPRIIKIVYRQTSLLHMWYPRAQTPSRTCFMNCSSSHTRPLPDCGSSADSLIANMLHSPGSTLPEVTFVPVISYKTDTRALGRHSRQALGFFSSDDQR